jgi:hypothetical protein
MEHAIRHPRSHWARSFWAPTLLGALARWMLIAALMTAYWPFGHQARGSTPPTAPMPSARLEEEDAQSHIQKALYTSGFERKGRHYVFAVSATRSSLPSASTEGPTSASRFVATISHQGRTVATCRRKPSGELPSMDNASMLLRCEGELFAPASGMAKFRFGRALTQPSLALWSGTRGAVQEVALGGGHEEKRMAKTQ